MSNGKHLAAHPDENLLSAFAEHSLTPRERDRVLEHLSTCARCRDIVFLTQTAGSEVAGRPVAVPVPDRVRRGWVWWGALGAAGVLAVLLVAVSIAVYRYRGYAGQKAALPASTIAQNSSSVAKLEPQPEVPEVLKAQRAPVAPNLPKRGFRGGAPPTGIKDKGEITGSVADRSGAVIPGASVSVRALPSGKTHTAVTDKGGQFDVASLPSGNYRVEVQAPGFNRFTGAVTVQPSERASLDAKLDVGSASQTVAVSGGSAGGAAPVTPSVQGGVIGGLVADQPQNLLVKNAAPPASPAPPGQQAAPLAAQAPAAGGPLATGRAVNEVPEAVTFPVSDGVIQRCINARCVARPLPSAAKAFSAAGRGQTVMAVDTDGNLFLSSDQGEHWEQAKVQWEGKAVSVGLESPQGQAMDYLLTGEAATGRAVHGAVAKKKAPVPAAAPLEAPATIFELTNNKGQIWATSDSGKTWLARRSIAPRTPTPPPR